MILGDGIARHTNSKHKVKQQATERVSLRTLADPGIRSQMIQNDYKNLRSRIKNQTTELNIEILAL